jgi:lipoprotein-anchoring transpeptidase ErfK/SrfK
MHKQPEGFVAETVDEQIERFALIGRDQQPPSEACVVQDLQGLYVQVDSPEQVRRSLDNIWARLADEVSPVNQTMFSAPDTDSLRVPGGGLASDAATRPPLTLINGQFAANQSMGKRDHASRNAISLPVRPRSRKQSLRRTLTLSALAAVVLLSVFSWSMVTRLAVHPSTITGSGPGTSTMTPIPATPAPQSLRSQVQGLLTQFHQEVTDWGQTHQFHDNYNNKSYPLDYEYDQQGIGGVLDHMVQQASSSADFQATLTLIQNELTNLHAMEANSTDQKPWNQVHNADTSLLNHYQFNSGVVVVVSLLEQNMRVYQHGQLLKAFQITTGRYELPTLPGSWQVLSSQTNVTLVSASPRGSPDWYPPMLVNYALGFHTGGYLIFDSWWRATYGPGTNFPHHDTGGNESFAGNGSQGGVNLPKSDMAWLYTVAQVNTPVVIY